MSLLSPRFERGFDWCPGHQSSIRTTLTAWTMPAITTTLLRYVRLVIISVVIRLFLPFSEMIPPARYTTSDAHSFSYSKYSFRYNHTIFLKKIHHPWVLSTRFERDVDLECVSSGTLILYAFVYDNHYATELCGASNNIVHIDPFFSFYSKGSSLSIAGAVFQI